MWANRPVGQLEKCAEAGALRRAFPEEIGNDLTAEEMAGQRIIDGAAHAPEKPKPESISAAECRRRAQAAPAARVATTVANRTSTGRAVRTVRRPAKQDDAEIPDAARARRRMRKTPMPWFRKHHTCPCGTDWWDEWDCLCNDRCPMCNAEIEPDEHEAIEGDKSAKIRALNDRLAQIVDRRTRRHDGRR